MKVKCSYAFLPSDRFHPTDLITYFTYKEPLIADSST